MDVLIFDDDPLFSDLLGQVVEEAGLSCEKYMEGSNALGIIRRSPPKLVFCSLVLPEMDGISICAAVKADPKGRGVKFVLLFNKIFKEQQDDALQAGAAAFISKKSGLSALKAEVLKHLDELKSAPPPPPPPKPAPSPIRIKLWGTEICVGPGETKIPATCVTMDLGGRLLILDAGTALKEVLQASWRVKNPIWMLLSHKDRTAGLAALKHAFSAEAKVKIGAPSDGKVSFRRLVAEVVPKHTCGIEVFSVKESDIKLWSDVRMRSIMTEHPGTTLAFRLDREGKSFVYCPLNEIPGTKENREDYREKLIAFFKDADVLVHDARYLDADYTPRAGRGHSHPSAVVELARKANVRRLILFDPDPAYSWGGDLETAIQKIRAGLPEGDPMRVVFARAGASIDI